LSLCQSWRRGAVERIYEREEKIEGAKLYGGK